MQVVKKLIKSSLSKLDKDTKKIIRECRDVVNMVNYGYDEKDVLESIKRIKELIEKNDKKMNDEIIKREKDKETETQNDTKEQLVKKVAQALLMDEIERYRKAPNCDVNQTIIEHESRICLEKARKVVEFLEKVEE